MKRLQTGIVAVMLVLALGVSSASGQYTHKKEFKSGATNAELLGLDAEALIALGQVLVSMGKYRELHVKILKYGLKEDSCKTVARLDSTSVFSGMQEHANRAAVLLERAQALRMEGRALPYTLAAALEMDLLPYIRDVINGSLEAQAVIKQVEDECKKPRPKK